MNRFFSHILSSALVASAVLALSSCVKESREACPCFLDLLLREPGTAAIESRITTMGRTASRMFHVKDTQPQDGVEAVTLEVPKGEAVSLCAVKGNTYMQDESGVLTIPQGEESSQVFAWRDMVVCEGESAADTVRWAKQFARLRMEMVGTEPFGDVSLRVKGSWSGTDLFTLSPVRGQYDVPARKMPDGRFEVRLPRQGDDTLMLQMYAEGMDAPETEFPLGRIIAASGFDWAAESLADIDVVVDYSDTEISVAVVSDWVEENQGEKEV